MVPVDRGMMLIRHLGNTILLLALTTGLLSQSCTDPAATTTEPVAIEAAITGPPKSAAEMLKALDTVTGKEGQDFNVTLDVRTILAAQAAEESGETEQAQKHWFEALGRADGQFAKIAFEGWVQRYVTNLGKKTDAEVLAKLLLAETRNGLHNRYMLSEGLTVDAAVVEVLWKLVPDSLIPPTTSGDEKMDDEVGPPPSGIPADDPLLTETSTRRCQAKSRYEAEWTSWSSSLPVSIRVYWNALVNHCSGRVDDAMAEYNSVYSRLGASRETSAMAIEALDRLAVLQRRNGRRPGAADSYLAMMNIWRTHNPTAKDMGLKPEIYAQKKINNALWAARYRAYIGDYENGKIFANLGLDYIAAAYTSQSFITDKTRRELAILRAEAYHILAYRIALEKKEYDQAVAMNVMAMQSKHLTSEWKDRLQWLTGLYEYLAGNYRNAMKHWEVMLAETSDRSMRPRLYFWLAKCYDRLNMKEESRFYMKAVGDDYPLNYYAVVAPDRSGLEGAKPWQEIFGDPAELKKRLATSMPDLSRVQDDDTLRNAWLRAETLAKAQILEFAQFATRDLQSEMNDRLLIKAHPEAFLALTRLQSRVGLYLRSISLTTQLEEVMPDLWQDYPEQLLIYFPTPYLEIYQRNAMNTSVDLELLMAISRQESGFTADIRSHADALGLMQLIKPTALKFADRAGVSKDNLSKSLINPEMNVMLGSYFLRFLNLRYESFRPAVYGAYNAGEDAMDLWLERRRHSDPLVFVELVPFGETKGYIKNVWRNFYVYNYLTGNKGEVKILPPPAASLQQPEQRRAPFREGPEPVRDIR